MNLSTSYIPRDVSPGVDGDDAFESLLRKSWHLRSPPSSQQESNTNIPTKRIEPNHRHHGNNHHQSLLKEDGNVSTSSRPLGNASSSSHASNSRAAPRMLTSEKEDTPSTTGCTGGGGKQGSSSGLQAGSVRQESRNGDNHRLPFADGANKATRALHHTASTVVEKTGTRRQPRKAGAEKAQKLASANLSRGSAAVHVQRAFRGHKGRNRAAAEGRKRARQKTLKREVDVEEERRAKSRFGRLPRPKFTGVYGF